MENSVDRIPGPIGVFDSGYGGLTILNEFLKDYPEYDFVYLGDNARTPYGTRSYDTVYRYTLENVKLLFKMGAHLVILACNTASAKALRTIQQRDLPLIDKGRRVLGVVRPSTEIAGKVTRNGHIGILGTTGTIQSGSYMIEIQKFFPGVLVSQQACPMWVPIVENDEIDTPGAEFFVKRDLDLLFAKDPQIDTLILGCTHYPLLMSVIEKHIPANVKIMSQGEIVSASLKKYLERHSGMDDKCSKNGVCSFYTTGDSRVFDEASRAFLDQPVKSQKIEL